MDRELVLSVGQAYVTPEKQRHRSSMAARVSQCPLLKAKGASAVIASAQARNAIAGLASDVGVEAFLEDYFATPEHWRVKASATRVLRALNTWFHDQSRHIDQGGYVCSLSALIFFDRKAHLFHVGDTQIHRLRGAEFEQLSRDHLTELGGYRYPSRALGMDASLDIDYVALPLKQGDIFLFTTQNVRGILLPSDFVRLIREDVSDLDGACERLVDAARARSHERGHGGDQYTFQLLRIDRLPEAQEETPGTPYGTLPVPPELVLGQRLDGLEVLEVLSRTSRSRVYRVRDLISQQVRVMKAPSPELSNRNAYLEHFLLQQWVVERVKSPFVAKAVESSRPRRYLYYLMEYVDGQRLSDWVRQHPRASLAQRLDIAQQLGKAVRALHRQDLLHQRIHPDNVLVDGHGKVVLADFNACRLREGGEHKNVQALARQVGLTEHSAPEYALDDPVGRRSDQYSLASTIYWLLTGALPYALALKGLRRHTDLEGMIYRSARFYNPQISPAQDKALCRALDPQRELRYRRLSEFLYALREPRSEQAVRDKAPLYEPVKFWQGVAGILLLLLVLSWLLK